MAHAMRPTGIQDELLIVLNWIDAGDPEVRAVELSFSTVRVRFTAVEARGLEQVFRTEVANAIRSMCRRHVPAPYQVEEPDFSLGLGGLLLEGCSIAANGSDGESQSLSLRIGRVAGNVLGIFRQAANSEAGLAKFTPRILAGPEAQLGSKRLFDEMLSQLYLPLVNLNAYLRHMLDGSAPGRGEPLSHSVVQLKTRAETLQFAFDRLIAEQMVERYATEPGKAVPELDTTAA